ncbi:MAG: heme NO-binding domain-containing protein [Magnetococcales bacterium]|nr:heme NO-binding domain-containing protein [Magnetococcales bacterium]
MYGLVLQKFEAFAESALGESWRQGRGEEPEIDLNKQYPDQVMHDLLSRYVALSGTTQKEALHVFGGYLAPQLVETGTFLGLMREEWGLFDLITHANERIHSVLKTSEPEMQPPEIRILRVSGGELRIYYDSARKLCPLLIGILNGLSNYFGESITLSEEHCMLEGDDFCAITIRSERAGQHVPGSLQDRLDFIQRVDGSLVLFNMYQGVPISFPAKVLETAGEGFTCTLHPFQVVALQHENSSHISSPLLPFSLYARVESLDLSRRTAIFSDLKRSHGAVGQRRFVRIIPDKAPKVTMRVGTHTIEGTLQELSLGGVQVGLDASIFADIESQVHLPMRAQFLLPVPHTKDTFQQLGVTCRMLRVIQEEDRVVLILVVTSMHSSFNAIVQHYVTQKQMDILNVLKEEAHGLGLMEV